MYYLANAFSLNMLPGAARMVADPLDEGEFIRYLTPYIEGGYVTSVIGHQGTALVLSAKFGVTIEMNRTNLTVQYGDSLYVAQLGIRLPEGQVLTEEELASTPMTYWVVTVMEQVRLQEDYSDYQ